MFGFGKKPDHYPEFLEYLTERWRMKPRYAAAFLNAYRTDISVMHEEGLKRLDASVDLSRPENRLLAHQMPDPRDFALVGQAYKAYLNDLRRGRYVDTDVEVAIWAVLCNRSDLLESVDKPLAKYVTENQQAKFPTLFEDALVE